MRLRRILPLAWLLAALTAGAHGQDPQRVPRPEDAVEAAVADALSLPEDARPFQRYLWDHRPSRQRAGAVAYVLNAVLSRSNHYRRPAILHDGSLLRFDLRQFTPESGDLTELRDLWEDLALVNYYFHTVREVPEQKHQLVSAARYLHTDGKYYTQKWVLKPTGKKIKTAEFALHAGPKLHLLGDLVGSRNPIMRADQFTVLATTQLNGGLYYKLAGIKKSDDPKVTDYDRFLADWSVDLKFLEERDLIQRAALFRSGVTGKPRMIEFFSGSNRVTAGGLIVSTLDTADADVDAAADPVRNLLEFRFAAREVIAAAPNGTLKYALFNAAGELQDVVPPDIARDHTIPSPHTAQLEPAIGCIRCHGPDDGWIRFRNDVRIMLAGRLEAYDDESQKDRDPVQTYERLLSSYKDDPEPAIRIARNLHSWATFNIAGQDFKDTSSTLADMFARYRFDALTPQSACYELGYQVSSQTEAVAIINKYLPPLPGNRFGVSPEDPIVDALRLWQDERPETQMPINRFQWELVFSDLALRAITQETLRLNEEQPAANEGGGY